MPPDENSVTRTLPSRRTGRKLAVIAGGFLAVVLGVMLLFALLTRALLNPAAVADRLEPRISAALNRPVEIEGARLDFWPRPALRLSGIRVANRGVFEGTAFATVDALELQPRLLPLLRREVVVDRLTVRSPRVLLRVTEDGITNFGDFVPEPEPGTEPTDSDGALALDLRRIEVLDGRVGLDDRRRGRVVRLNGLGVDANLARTGDGAIETAGRATVDSFTARLPGLVAEPVDLAGIDFAWSGSAGPELDAVEILDGTLSVGALDLRVAGRLHELKSAVRRVDLSLVAEGVPLADLAAAAREPGAGGWELDGLLGLDLRVRGEVGPDRRPDLSGLATVRGATARWPGEAPLLAGFDAEARLEGERADVTAAGRLADGSLSAEGTVALDSLLPMDLRVRAEAGLEALRAAMPAGGGRGGAADPVTAQGRIAIDARVRGPAGEPASARLDGGVELRGLEVHTGALAVPLRIAEGRLELVGRDIRWSNLDARLGDSRLRSTGVLRDPLGAWAGDAPAGLDADLRSASLDLGAALPAGDDDIGWGRLVSARLGERRIEGRSAAEVAVAKRMRRPSPPPLQGEVRLRLDTVRWHDQSFTDVAGALWVDRDRIDLSGLRFGAWGGRAAVSGSVALGGEALEPFGLRLLLEDVRAEQWLARHTPLGDVIRGTMSLDLELAGGLDTLLLPSAVTLTGAGAARIRDGSVAPNPFTEALAAFVGLGGLSEVQIRSWVSPFRIEDGRLVLSDAVASLGSAEAGLSGAVGFGGSLDLGMVLRPDSARSVSLAESVARALPTEVRGALDRGTPVELGLRVGGQLTRPTFSLDAGATRAGFERAAEDVVEQGVERALDEARQRMGEGGGESEMQRQGLDLLRRLTGGAADTAAGGDTTVEAAPDTIGAADSIGADGAVGDGTGGRG